VDIDYRVFAWRAELSNEGTQTPPNADQKSADSRPGGPSARNLFRQNGFWGGDPDAATPSEAGYWRVRRGSTRERRL